MALRRLNLLRPLLVQQVRRPPAVTSRLKEPPSLPSTACCPTACVRLYATKKAKGQ